MRGTSPSHLRQPAPGRSRTSAPRPAAREQFEDTVSFLVMNKDPRLLVVSGTNFLRAYSGIKYLCNSLTDGGIAVEAYAPIPRNMIPELAGCRFPVHSLFAPWYGKIPRLRIYLFRAQLFIKSLLDDDAIMFSELTFFRDAVMHKKLKPQLPFIHYCQELLTPEEFPESKETRFYERDTDCVDLTIDVDSNRAALRRTRFNLTREILVLPNTLPLSDLPPPAPVGTLSQLAGGNLPEGVPILIYIGGTHKGTGFDTIIKAVARVSRPLFFLGFCYGRKQEDVDLVRRAVESHLGSKRGRICNAVPRVALLSCLHEASAGLVYYPYTDAPSANQLYCAPTKVFEYIAVGLPVVASANPPLISLIEDNQLGVCAKDDSVAALHDAIECLLTSPKYQSDIRQRSQKLFAEQLCFEKVALPVVARVKSLLRE